MHKDSLLYLLYLLLYFTVLYCTVLYCTTLLADSERDFNVFAQRLYALAGWRQVGTLISCHPHPYTVLHPHTTLIPIPYTCHTIRKDSLLCISVGRSNGHLVGAGVQKSLSCHSVSYYCAYVYRF